MSCDRSNLEKDITQDNKPSPNKITTKKREKSFEQCRIKKKQPKRTRLNDSINEQLLTRLRQRVRLYVV